MAAQRPGLTQALGGKEEFLAILGFLLYSAFCYWVIFLDGADELEDWKSFFIFSWFAASLNAQELKFYVGISWLASLTGLLFMLFGGN